MVSIRCLAMLAVLGLALAVPGTAQADPSLTPPSPPMNVHVEETADGPLVSWDAPAWDGGAGADLTYRVYRDGFLVADGVLEREYLDVTVGAGMSAAVSYTYHVSAVNDAGEGPIGGECVYDVPPVVSPDNCVDIVVGLALWLVEKVLCIVADITETSC